MLCIRVPHPQATALYGANSFPLKNVEASRTVIASTSLMESASGWLNRGSRLRMNAVKVSLSCLCASALTVSNTKEDFPEPETPVKIVIFRFGIRTFTFFRLFSRAPLIMISSMFIDSTSYFHFFSFHSITE